MNMDIVNKQECSDELRLKRSKVALSRKDLPEVQANLAKGRAANKGKHWDEETRRRMGDGKIQCQIKRTCLKTGEIKIYSSNRAAGEDGFSKAKVSDCCLGKRNSHRGFSWKKL